MPLARAADRAGRLAPALHPNCARMLLRSKQNENHAATVGQSGTRDFSRGRRGAWIMADPFSEGHAADRAKASAEAAKKQITDQDARVQAKHNAIRARQEEAKKPYKGYPMPRPFWEPR